MAAGTGSEEVSLNVYDLSNGLAAQLSMAMVGTHFPAIYHTGIVCYGREYFFGGGLFHDAPGRTPYGVPIETVRLGTTTKSRAEFEAWIDSVRHKFTINTYNVFSWNCNNFTNEASLWLTNNAIPQRITDLPNDFLATPLGQMIKPMIDGMMTNLNNQAAEQYIANPGGSMAAFDAIGQQLGGGMGAAPAASPPAPSLALARSTELVLFRAANVTAVFKKLRKFLEEEANVDGGEEAPESVSADLLASLEAALDADEFPSELDLASVYAAVADLIAFLPLDKHFPVLDVWRLLVLREDCNAHYAADESVATYITGLFGPGAADGDGPSKAVSIMSFRLLANMFAHESGAAYVAIDGGRVEALLAAAIAGMGHAEARVRQAASAVFYNCSLHMEKGLTDAVLMVIGCVVERAAGEDDEETLFRMLVAVAHMTVDTPDAAVLCKELGFDPAPLMASASDKVARAARELDAILAAV